MSPAALRDRGWMEQALALAALGEGSTGPNPRVGCVLVRGGRLVGWGFHRAAGDCHAESRAIEVAGARARGATVYVNLEPCAHRGRTAPCADLLVESGVEHVFASIIDPNPQVDGRGFHRLRDAGIEVEVGLLAQEARLLNEPFLHWHATGRPLVTLKAAASLDGMLSALSGRSRWITGEPARRFAHRLRLRHDAILVGAGTVRRDDPQLTVRLPGFSVTRQRALLAPSLEVSPDARIFDRADRVAPPTRVYVSSSLAPGAESRFGDRAQIIRVPEAEGRLDLGEVIGDLGRLGAQSVLVEGGGKTFAAFLEAGLADRVVIFQAPLLLGARGGTPLVDRISAGEPAQGFRLAEVRRFCLGEDVLVMGRLSGHASAS